MDEGTRRIIIFISLGLIWGSLVIHLMAPSLGFVAPGFSRPQSDYELFAMLISGIILVGYSVKTGINYLRPP